MLKLTENINLKNQPNLYQNYKTRARARAPTRFIHTKCWINRVGELQIRAY